jgi:hypothetical protein
VIGTDIKSREDRTVGLRTRLIKSRFLGGHDCIEWYGATRDRSTPKLGGAIGHNT